MGHEVIAIGGRKGVVGDIEILTGHPDIKEIHTITIYMGKQRQEKHHSYLLGLKPKRILFNPGAENTILYQAAKVQGIEVLNSCTLVMLKTKQY